MVVAEERKDRLKAALITLIISALILLFLFLYKIITPIPPFPLNQNADGGMEMNFGIYDEGTGTVEGPAIGDATSVVVENNASQADETPVSDETVENGEPVLEKKEKHPKVKNNTTVITPDKKKEEVKKEDNSASSLLNAYTKNKNKGTGGGDGNSGDAGNEGSPDGNPNTDGKGGHGNNPDFNGNGPGKGGNGVSLSGRKILVPPPKVSDGKEEGMVVVIITVDKQGNVIEADPTGKGTNTSSAVLKSKARQAALQAKFTPSDKYDTQKGSIIFKFLF